MPRPCGHDELQTETCVICDLFVRYPYHRARWSGEPVLPKSHIPRPGRPLCVHRGEEADGPTRVSLALEHSKVWVTCEKGHDHKSGYVCSCKGCGPKCGDYTVK